MGSFCSQQTRQNCQDQILMIESQTDIKEDDDIKIMQITLLKPKFLNYQLEKQKFVRAPTQFLDKKASQEVFAINSNRKLKGILKQQNQFSIKRANTFDQIKCVRFNFVLQDQESQGSKNLVKLIKLLNHRTIQK
ncbi:unnamed protein product [Paramecium sonneborni]|uniref:Uncharacterized protein n=1 Tax=Paramecium sonneborni TaxID=65129 RepID=A0A8S1JXC9_9CILI|nr:unnamed protein product [Paramecium sonneborni]